MTEQQPQLKLPPISNKFNISTENNKPFNIPNDNEVFRLSKQSSQSINKSGKIWQKNTASCRNPLKRFDKYTVEIDDKYIPSHVYNTKEQKLIEDALELINMRKKNKDMMNKKQIIVDVLEQKKEMFLVTMTHGIIQSEIENLKNQGKDRKNALQQSEKLLLEDKKSFEIYQQKYKQETKKAEQMYQIQVQNRKVKQQLLKSKSITTSSLRAQKIRNEQNVASYLKYKQFLDKLPPKEWVQQKNKQRIQKTNKIKEMYFERWLKEQSQQENKKNSKSKLTLNPDRVAEYQRRFDQMLKNQQIQQIDELANEEQMYFKQPHQLIEYFNNLEEANLFCMQQAQTALQSFQSLKGQFQEKKTALESKYKFLVEHKGSLEKQLNQIEASIKSMKKKKQVNNSNISEKDNKDLKSTIFEEYIRIKQQMTGFLPQIQNNITQPLPLLGCIEICMERLLEKLLEASSQQPKMIKDLRTALERKKTSDKREQVALQNKLEQEKRKSRNQNKKQPISRNVGRIDMMRSPPIVKEVTTTVEVVDNSGDQDRKYLME